MGVHGSPASFTPATTCVDCPLAVANSVSPVGWQLLVPANPLGSKITSACAVALTVSLEPAAPWGFPTLAASHVALPPNVTGPVDGAEPNAIVETVTVPFLSVPSEQEMTGAGPVQEADEFVESNVAPAGSVTFTMTCVSVLGPLLVKVATTAPEPPGASSPGRTCMVNVALAPASATAGTTNTAPPTAAAQASRIQNLNLVIVLPFY